MEALLSELLEPICCFLGRNDVSEFLHELLIRPFIRWFLFSFNAYPLGSALADPQGLGHRLLEGGGDVRLRGEGDIVLEQVPIPLVEVGHFNQYKTSSSESLSFLSPSMRSSF